MHSVAARRVIRRASVVLLLLSLAPAGLAQHTAQGPDLARLDTYFAQALEDWSVPGMAIAIVKDGKVVLAKGYGVREMGKPDRVGPDTLFAIASNTKAFTSAALAMLVEENKIGWNDRVTRHLPYFQLYDPYVSHDMRIRDLLSHRSGLATFSGDLLWYGTPFSREEVIRRARFLRQATPFRTTYGYSNIMFIAAGEVVAAASGRTWDEFVKARIFAPLGMTRTVTSVESLAAMTDVATPHAAVRGAALRAFPWASWDTCAAAGGIISSASDLSKWLLLQLNRGTLDGRTYFSDASSRLMWTPHVAFTIGRAASERFPSVHFRAYGLGWSLSDYLGEAIVQHGGAADGMFSQVTLVPARRLGFVILTNSNTGLSGALHYAILDAFLGGSGHDWSRESLQVEKAAVEARRAQDAKLATPTLPNARPSLPLTAYAGTYAGDLYGEATVTLEQGQLVLRLLSNPDLVADLSPWQLDTFALRWRKAFPWFGDGRVQFVLDKDARVTELKLDVPNDDFWFYELDFRKIK